MGNGSHDDTSAFAAAYAAILAEGAGVLYIPYGTYNISSGLVFTVPVMVVGDGIGISIVSCSDNTATIFTFQGSNSGIRDISLTYSSVGTGTAILLNNSQEVFNFQRIYITNCGYGIHITDYVLVNGTQFEIVNYTNGGVWIDNGGRVVTISDFHMYAGSDILGANGGIYLSGAQDSFSAFDGQILTGVRGIYGVESLAIANFYNIYCDTTAQEPLYILNWVDVFFTNCWFSGGRTGSGYDGVFIGGGANTIKFVACKFQNNGANGIFVASSCANVTISDSTSNNNMYTASLGAGIWIEAGASKFSISHNTINNEIGIGWGTQSYGVVIDTGCDHYIYDGNLIGGNTYGNINNSSGAANAYIAGNLS